MIQTFQFRTETEDKKFYHTIHTGDIKSAVEKWLRQIEDLQSQVYSFDTIQVQNIKQQYSNGQLKVNVDREPYFLSFQTKENQTLYT